MNISKLNDYLQLFASIGVLIGLLLVAQEIRQNNELAKATTINDLYKGWETLSISEFQSDISDLVVKATEQPESLSSAEIVRLNSWYVAVVSLYGRQNTMYQQYGLSYDPKADIEAGALMYFSSRFGRSWFKENRDWIEDYDPEFTVLVSRIIAETPVDNHVVLADRIRAGF